MYVRFDSAVSFRVKNPPVVRLGMKKRLLPVLTSVILIFLVVVALVFVPFEASSDGTDPVTVNPLVSTSDISANALNQPEASDQSNQSQSDPEQLEVDMGNKLQVELI